MYPMPPAHSYESLSFSANNCFSEKIQKKMIKI